MVMNAFDTNFDGENEVYAVNTVAHAYMKKPIRIAEDRPVRIYLVNVIEFDPINSFHLHANFFDYYDQGTTLTPTLKTVDLIMQCQAQRGILEFSYSGPRARPLHVPRAPVRVHRTRLGRHVRRRGGTGMNDAAPTPIAVATPPAAAPARLALLWIVLPLAVLGLAIWWLIAADPLQKLQQRRAAGREPDLRAHGARRRRHRRAGAGRRLGADDHRPGAGRRRLLAVHAGSARADRARRDAPGSRCRFPGCWARRMSSTSSPTPARRSSTRSRSPCRRRRPTGRALIAQALLGVFVGIAAGRDRADVLPGAARRRPERHELPARADRRPARLPVRRCAGGRAGARRRGRGALPGADDGRARRRRQLPAADGGRPPTTARRRDWRSRPSSRSASACTISAKGLAIGAAFAAGAAGLGTFLVLGFTLHNVTEGIGIAAPILKERPPLLDLRRPDAARGRPGGHRPVDRQPRLCAAMVGAGAGDRRRRDPAGDRRGDAASAWPRRHAGRAVLAGRACRPRRRRRCHVCDRDAGEDLIPPCGSGNGYRTGASRFFER